MVDIVGGTVCLPHLFEGGGQVVHGPYLPLRVFHLSGYVECQVVIMECGNVVVGIVVHVAQYAVEQETYMVIGVACLLLDLFQQGDGLLCSLQVVKSNAVLQLGADQ